MQWLLTSQGSSIVLALTSCLLPALIVEMRAERYRENCAAVTVRLHNLSMIGQSDWPFKLACQLKKYFLPACHLFRTKQNFGALAPMSLCTALRRPLSLYQCPHSTSSGVFHPLFCLPLLLVSIGRSHQENYNEKHNWRPNTVGDRITDSVVLCRAWMSGSHPPYTSMAGDLVTDSAQRKSALRGRLPVWACIYPAPLQETQQLITTCTEVHPWACISPWSVSSTSAFSMLLFHQNAWQRWKYRDMIGATLA